MSSRQASPPPVKRWPFLLGDALLLAVAFGAVAAGGQSPLETGTIIVVAACALLGVGLFVTPFLLEYDARVRLAEASVRDQLDHQAKRLTQVAEQLSHAISRSQSTEEQAGQVLGTLEELSEKLASQSDDLAQSLARASDREVNELKAEVERLARDREQQFSALNGKVASISTTIQEAHSATKLSIAAHARVVDDIHLRLDAIGARVEEFSKAFNHFRAMAPPAVDKAPKSSPPPAAPQARKDEARQTAKPAPAPAEDGPPPPGATLESLSQPASGAPASDAPAAEASEPVVSVAEKPVSKTAKQESPKHGHSNARVHPEPPPAAKRSKPADEGLELPLEGMPEPRQPMKHSRRDLAGATSIVATAYIGIGNKLFVRGEGPGLTWERGVPMQFLAIGKWGWTTTDAGGPVTCRIFRNDETPMLDADVVIAPGEKAEITPRF